MKNCRTTSSNRFFTFTENRSSLTLVNKRKIESTRIEVDGCEINDDGLRCDFLLTTKDLDMYIELKGNKVNHAIDQLKRTIKLLGSKQPEKTKVCYIICSRSPLFSTEIQNLDRQFREKYNSQLIVKSSHYKSSY